MHKKMTRKAKTVVGLVICGLLVIGLMIPGIIYFWYGDGVFKEIRYWINPYITNTIGGMSHSRIYILIGNDLYEESTKGPGYSEIGQVLGSVEIADPGYESGEIPDDVGERIPVYEFQGYEDHEYIATVYGLFHNHTIYRKMEYDPIRHKYKHKKNDDTNDEEREPEKIDMEEVLYQMTFDMDSDNRSYVITYSDGMIYIKRERGGPSKDDKLYGFEGEPEDVYVESMEDFLGETGYKLFIRKPNPYGAEVHYITSYQSDVCHVYENNAVYENGKYKDDFSFPLDFNGDGTNESFVSNVSYVGDGGMMSFLYQAENPINGHGFFVEARLFDLLGIPEDKLEQSPVTVCKSWYEEKTGKVRIEYKLKGEKKVRETRKKISLDKLGFDDCQIKPIEEYFDEQYE